MTKNIFIATICLLALNAQEDEKHYKLPTIKIQGNKTTFYEIGGGSSITADFIDEFPSGNGQITSFLKINPNIQFSNSFESSKTPGEIDPADISINGATFYQNLFRLDGFSMNNDLNPVANNPASQTSIPGRSQGLAIDASLIDNIHVYDSNISAAYGGFEGGVIDAQTKNPSKDFKAKVSYQFTSSKLTKYHIYPSEYENFVQSNQENAQPEFFKYFIRTQAQGYIGKNFGLIGSFTTTQSIIPLHLYAPKDSKSDKKNNRRSIYNYFLKGVYDGIENLSLEASVAYMPQNNQYFIKNTKDSQYSILSGGYQALLRASYRFHFANFTNSLAYSDENNSRKGQKQYYKVWKPSDEKNWGTKTMSAEGTWGNVNSTQRKIAYKSDMDFEELELWNTKHSFTGGIALNYTSAYYARPNDFHAATAAYKSQTPLKPTQSCSEFEYCSESSVPLTKGIWKDNIGQYFSRLDTYEKGKISLDNFAYSAYMEDNMTLWRVHFRPGLRLDGDTYMQKVTLAPRMALSIDVFGNGITNIIGGYNRYYGRNIFAYRLQDGINALMFYQTRNSPTTDWSDPIRSKSNVKFEHLKIPYNDEFVGGISQKFWKFKVDFKYIHRNSKDEITRMSHSKAINPLPDDDYAPIYFTYTNNGKSKSDIFSLSLETLQPLQYLNIYQHFLLSANYSKIRRNFVDYDTNFSDDTILFEGKIIQHSQLPPNNFAKPWSAKLTTITNVKFSHLFLTWTNFLSFHSGYQGVVNIGNKISNDGKIYKEYKIFDFPSAFNWDTRISINTKVWGKNKLFVNLDVFNLLDNLNIIQAKISSSKGTTTTTPTYQAGRSFWLQAGYEF